MGDLLREGDEHMEYADDIYGVIMVEICSMKVDS